MTKQELIKLLDLQVQDASQNIEVRKHSGDVYIKAVAAMYQGRKDLALQLIDLLHTQPEPVDHREWDSEEPWSGWVI